jgi:predicted metal-binding membrane protein
MSTMRAVPSWDASYFLMMLLMWTVMMVGMMLPTIAPTVLVYAAVARKSRREGVPTAPTATFVSGYVLVWALFSVAATGAQWGLSELALLSPGNDLEQLGVERRASHRGGDLSVAADQGSVSYAMPISC